jgi:hypothetical protein
MIAGPAAEPGSSWSVAPFSLRIRRRTPALIEACRLYGEVDKSAAASRSAGGPLETPCSFAQSSITPYLVIAALIVKRTQFLEYPKQRRLLTGRLGIVHQHLVEFDRSNDQPRPWLNLSLVNPVSPHRVVFVGSRPRTRADRSASLVYRQASRSLIHAIDDRRGRDGTDPPSLFLGGRRHDPLHGPLTGTPPTRSIFASSLPLSKKWCTPSTSFGGTKKRNDRNAS